MRGFGLRLAVALIGFASCAQAQDLPIYTDTLQNGFQDFSYGGGSDFANAAPVHAGNASIAFTGNANFGGNAVSFAHPAGTFAAGGYFGLRFFVNGGAGGGQQLALILQTNSNVESSPVLANEIALGPYIAGGSVPANAWALVEVPFSALSFVNDGSFDRVDIRNASGAVQPVLYLDDVSLAAGPNLVFTDTFEGSPPPAGQFRFSSPTYSIGEAGGVATITVQRSNGSAGTVSVQYATSNGSALQPDDYSSASGTLNWGNGDSADKTFPVNVGDDLAVEGDETVNLHLLGPGGGATLGAPATATLTITDDDVVGPPGMLRFSATDYVAYEDGGAVTVTAERINGSSGAVSVQYATGNGSAQQPGDYASASGTLNWADGDAASKTFQITVTDDGVDEPDETVALTLSNPGGGAMLAAPGSATLTLRDPSQLFVPQYGTHAIKVFRRDVDGFVFVRTAPLGPTVTPNTVAFAPDGKLWVLDNGDGNFGGTGSKRLLRYSRQSIIGDVNPVAEVTIGALGANAGDVFDLAFFGDYAYVSQSDFGGTNRVLKYSSAQLAVSGNPVATVLSNANLSVPAGLAFDGAGRLWTANYNNSKLVRMNTTTGAADKVATNVAVGARDSLFQPEGIAFDASDTLWAGNNGRPTISGYASWQVDGAGFGATTPVHLIDVAPGVDDPGIGHTGFVGGLGFDRDGDLWGNYEDTNSILEYALTSQPRGGGLPGVGSYQVAAGQVLGTATTDPGFGGIAFWPPPAALHTKAGAFRGTNAVGMEMAYGAYPQATGPVAGNNYPVYDERLIDYFAGKRIATLRFLFSWEAMQSVLFGTIPASNSGNYKAYFDNYKRIVDYATGVKGMQVVVEPWQANPDGGAGGPRWRGNLVGSAQVPIAAWSDFWTKMATVFKDNPRVSFGLVNEPNQMSTMGWWTIAQAGVTAIRNSGAANRIYVPGNGYTAASTWVSGNYYNDPDPIKRSNAYGWLNANGPGQPITDPLGNIAAEVHTYLDASQGGLGNDISSVTAARDHLAPAVAEGRAQGYKVYLGEIGVYAGTPGASAAWADFISYFEANTDELAGYTWWAGGDPVFWPETQAAYFGISPTSAATYTGDTVNMDMIEGNF